MAKPANPVSWATDATFATGSEAGVAPRLEPSAGVKAQGVKAAEEFPARWANWAIGALGDWTTYLDNLPTDTDFVDAAFTWGGLHVFSNDVEIGDLEVTNLLTVASVDLTGSLTVQGDVKVGPAGEFYYADAFGVITPRARTVVVNLASSSDFSAPTGGSSAMLADGTMGLTGSASRVFELRLPRGATLTSVEAAVFNTTGGTINIGMSVYRYAPDFATFAAPAASSIGGDSEPTLASGAGALLSLAVSHGPIDNSLYEYRMFVTTSNGGNIRGVRVGYLDPGPRNG